MLRCTDFSLRFKKDGSLAKISVCLNENAATITSNSAEVIKRIFGIEASFLSFYGPSKALAKMISALLWDLLYKDEVDTMSPVPEL
ncbi:MAG: hypothetical protein ACP5I3_09660 [Thermoproteus sp.]